MSTHKKFALGHFLIFSLWLVILMTDLAKTVNGLLGDIGCSIISFATSLPFTTFVIPNLFDHKGTVVSSVWVYVIFFIVAAFNSWCIGGLLNLIWKCIAGHFRYKREAVVALKKEAEQGAAGNPLPAE